MATFGCKVNQCDSAGLAQSFRDAGYVPVSFGAAAQAVCINTCTVTGRSDCQARQLIRRARRLYPGAPMVVTGCYAQVDPRAVAALPGVRFVAGNREKPLLSAWLPAIEAGLAGIAVSDTAGAADLFSPCLSVFPGHSRAFLKVQDGCSSACAYCIVPRARGRSRSLAVAEVLRRAALLVQGGHEEIVLTGIHLGRYGLDLVPPATLEGLLRCLREEAWPVRFRLGSIEVTEITTDLISLLGDDAFLCRHVHLPLQSGDDEILRRMGRPYTRDLFREVVSALADAVPHLAIGVDVMAGFPGETDQAFQRTRDLLASLPISYVHAFPFSRRPGTAASAMAGQVPDAVKTRRAALLRELGLAKRAAFARRFLGRPLTVVLEARQGNDAGEVVGVSDNYLAVVVSGEAGDAPGRALVLPDAWTQGRLYAKRLSGP